MPPNDAEDLIREAEGRFGRTFEHASIGMALADLREGRFLKANQALCTLLGYSEAELRERTLLDVTHPEDRPPIERLMAHALAGGTEPLQLEKRCLRSDGAIAYCLISITPVADAHGRPLYFLAQGIDTTEARRTHREYETLLQGLSDLGEGVVLVDESRILYANDATFRISGYTEEELRAMPSFFDLFLPEQRAELVERFSRRLSGEPLPDRVEIPIVRKDGTQIDLEVAVKVLADGQPRILGIFRDVTERRTVERSRLDSERKFRAIVESAPDAMVIVDGEGRILLANSGAEALLGYRREELVGKPVEMLVPPRLRVRHLEHREAFATDLRARPMGAGLDLFALHRDGREIPVEISLGPIQTDEGILISASLRDVSARREAEARLRASEERYRLLAEHTTDVITRTRLPEGTLMYVSPASRTVLGYEPEELIGTSATDLIHPEDMRRLRDGEQTRFDAAGNLRLEYRARHRDGHWVWIESMVHAVTDDDGAAVETVSIARDVTKRKRAEEGLRERGQQLAEAQRLAHIGSFEWDMDTNAVRWSDELYRIYGLDQEQFGATYESFLEHVHPDDRELVVSNVAAACRDGTMVEFDERVIRPDGTVRTLHTEGRVVRDEDGRPLRLVGVCQDVTERVESERALRDSEERFRRLAENAQDIIFRYRFLPEPGFEYVSPATTAITGYTPEEHYADPTLGVRMVHPDDQHLLENLGSISQGPIVLRWVRKDGSIIWTEQRNVPVFEQSGRLVAIEGIARDVTDRILAEQALRQSERRYQEAYEREREVSERLRVLDDMKNSFLTAVSHEFRTPLTSILGFAETMAREDLAIDAVEAREMSRRILGGAQKLDRLLLDLLDLDRMSRGILEPRRRAVEVAALVHGVVESFESLMTRPVIVDARPVTATVDPAKVERIVENLLANAVKHTPRGTPIWVRVGPHEAGVLIAVEDAGPGIPTDLREAVFEPFQQGPELQAHAPGTGVGLSLVAGFASMHGGRAWVEERLGGGASFRVFLPGAMEHRAAAGA